MTPRTLGEAFVRILERTDEHDHDALFARLIRYLEARGASSLYPSVLREAHARAVRTRALRGGVISAASVEELKRVMDEARMRLTGLGAEGVPETRIDSTLVSGFIATCGSRRFDASGKSGLVSLYHHLLSHSSHQYV